MYYAQSLDDLMSLAEVLDITGVYARYFGRQASCATHR